MLSDLEDGVISAFGHENPPAGLNPGPEADDTSDNEALPVPGDSTFDDVVLSGLEDGLISDAEHGTPFGPNGGTPVGLNPVPEANTSGNDSLPVPVPNFSPLDEITEMNLFEDNDEPLLLPGLDTNDFGEFMEGFVVDDPTANSMPALGSAKKRVAEGRDATDESNPSQIPPKKRKQDSEEDRTCPHCSRVLCNKLSRDSHVKTVHGGNSTEKCPRCEALFQRKLQLGRHITKEHGKKTEVSCANCGARLMSNAALNAHNRQTHEPPQVASCSFCSGTFASILRPSAT